MRLPGGGGGFSGWGGGGSGGFKLPGGLQHALGFGAFGKYLRLTGFVQRPGGFFAFMFGLGLRPGR